MKKVLLFILVLFSFSAFSQIGNDVETDNAIIRNWIIYQGDTLAVISVNEDTIFITKGDELDTLIVRSFWNKTGNDIYNNNTGKITFFGNIYADTLPTATKTFWLQHWDNSSGRMEKVSPLSFYRDLQDDLRTSIEGGNPDTNGILIRDTDYGTLNPVTETDKVSTSTQNMPYQYLNYWKDDLIKSYFLYSKVDNAKMGFLGDSYTTNYAVQVKQQAHDLFGYGGGYEAFVQNYSGTNYGTFINSNATYTYDRDDPYVLHNRMLLSTSSGKVTKISCNRWNKVLLHYKTRPGGGVFTVKKGQRGSTLATIDTDAAAGDAWYMYQIKDSDQTIYDTIFFTSSDADSVTFYGFKFEYETYWPDEYTNVDIPTKKLEVSVMADGGAETNSFFTGKDTASIRQMMDTLDLSLLCFVNLDPITTFESDIDSLVGFLQMIRPEMDICLIAGHDDKSGYSGDIYNIWQQVAKSRGVAFIDAYTETGSLQSLLDAGLTTDSIHLASDFVEPFNLMPKLFPIANRQGALKVDQLVITDNTGIYKPNGTNFIFSSKFIKSTFTGLNNTFFGYKTGDVTTSGAQNTFIGYEVGIANTTGGNNTGLGNTSLFQNTTGSYNVGIGRNALYRNRTGEYNVAIGYLAGQGLDTYNYSYNILIGANAGQNLVGGSNTYIGANAGLGAGGGVSTGTLNVGIGGGSLKSNRAGDENTAVGVNSLNQNTNGIYNTAIGRTSLYSNTTGNANTAVGYYAGFGNTGNTNIYIGYYAGRYNTLSDRIFIGSGDKGSLAADSTQTWLYGNQAAKTMRVNATEINPKGTLANNDTSPSVAGANVWQYNGTANSVTLDALDDHVVGAFYTIIGNSDTYTITVIDGTPSGGDSFNLAGGNWVGGSQDVLMLYCIGADAFVEVSRSNN